MDKNTCEEGVDEKGSKTTRILETDLLDVLDHDGNLVRESREQLELSQKERASEHYLKSFSTSSNSLANEYEANARLIYKEYDKVLTDLREDLRKALTHVNHLGEDIVRELRTGHMNVKFVWEAYSRAVEPNNKGIIDVWLCEARYRLITAFLSICWKKCSQEMAKLVHYVKTKNFEREQCIQNCITSFCHSQELHWFKLPSTSRESLRWVVNNKVEKQEELDAKTSSLIHIEANRLQKSNNTPNDEMDSAQDENSFKVLNFDEGKSRSRNIELAHPLASELILSLKMLERRSSSFISSFKKSLAIETSDGYLHFFDVADELINLSKANNGPRLKDVFEALLPSIDVPLFEDVLSSDKGNSLNSNNAQARDWHDLLKPTLSLCLPYCSIHIDYDKRSENSVAEITEKFPTSGATSLFTKYTTRMFYLRAENSALLGDWVSELQNLRH